MLMLCMLSVVLEMKKKNLIFKKQPSQSTRWRWILYTEFREEELKRRMSLKEGLLKAAKLEKVEGYMDLVYEGQIKHSEKKAF